MTAKLKPEFRIRKAKPSDLDALVALENASFTGDRISRRRFQHWIGAGNGILVVAESAPTATGVRILLGYCLAFTRSNSTVARAYSLAIATAARGQGLGGRLLQRAEQAARKLGCAAMILEVAQGNQVAIALYEKLQYLRFGSIPAYYDDGQDAWRMRKTLARL